ncbi:MAG: PD-(D/E)XK nuclease family protein [Lachnospiraceae bacterium]|nr:PD-(D/E)XK nuclease family protein [Lachnospiraceae bacterium]
MAIQFIFGEPGTGKTKYIYEQMIQETQGDHPVILLLPEQANMGAEQDMIKYNPLGGTMDISILSFSRLAYYIFDKENVYTKDVLDDYGKSMLIMKVLKDKENELTYYSSMVGKSGFVDEVKSLLSELIQYNVTEEVLENVVKSISPHTSLYNKLNDIIIIRKAFEEAMGNTYMVAEQLMSLLAQNVEEAKLLKGASIYFDGFTGFTPIQYDVIRKLMRVCDNLYFSFSMDCKVAEDNAYSKYGLFTLCKESMDKLVLIASDEQITILPKLTFSDNYRLINSEELLYVEKNIFRYPVKSYEGSYDGNVTFVEADNIKEEIDCIAHMIKHLVMKEGYRYRDIAVITGDLENNLFLWKRYMKQLNIPYFPDINELLLHNPVVETVSLIIDVFDKDFSYDSIFSFLKTSFLPVSMDDIYVLDNYVLKYGIRGYSAWNKAFRKKDDNLDKINDTRKEVMKYFTDIKQVFSNAKGTVSDYIRSLYDFISVNELGKKLHEAACRFEGNGDLRQAKAYDGAYERFIQVLDKTMDILGDEVVSRSDFKDIIITGMSDMKLGIIPTTLDQVVIGDMERTRLNNVKVVFMACANEGILPGKSKEDVMFSERDREALLEHNITLSPGNKEQIFIKQYYLYLQMTKASDKLIISCHNADDMGGNISKSYFVKQLEKMMPNAVRVNSSAYIKETGAMTLDDMLVLFASKLAGGEYEDSSEYHVLMEQCPDKLADIIRGYCYMNQPGQLNDAIAKRLYGTSMVHSVSRLESYSSCRFSFFLRYGLGIEKREEYRIEVNHIGTILHGVMEKFFTKVRDKEITLPLQEEELKDKVAAITDECAAEIDVNIFTQSSRMSHQLDVIKRIALRSVNNLCRHLERGDMEPAVFEKRFSPEDNISYISMAVMDGIKMELSGIIDRVDIKETNDAVYVKIIDYKSGEKDIDYTKIIDGKQLQLAVYMNVMLELLQKQYPDKAVIPTGMYYYRLADKIVDGNTDEEVEKNRVKQSRMTGLANSDDNCLEHMDGKTGEVNPVLFKKSGELDSRNAHVVSTEELEALSKFTRNKMIEIGKNIICGQIDMNPQKGEKSSPCNYCDYRSICRFEAGLGGNTYGYGTQLSKEEAKRKVCGHDEDNIDGGEEL